MIPTNLTEIKINFYKIAKKHEISMSLCTEEEIEVIEKDKSKFNEFAREIKKINNGTKIVDLVGGNEHICIRGYDSTGGKSLYLVDDDYYNKLIGVSDE